jgi:hypothetical protein
MILDNTLLAADDLAYNGTPTVLDLGSTGKGKGTPIKCFAIGSSALAGSTGVTVTDGATSTAADALTTVTATNAEMIRGIEFELPAHVNRYVKISLTAGSTAGTWSAGIVLDAQNNF